MTDITCDRSGDITGRSGDTTGKATFRAIHTDSLIEILADAIYNDWSNNALRVIINELHNKGYNRDRLIKTVERNFGKEACLKIIRIIFS